jgi:hypothetical protein
MSKKNITTMNIGLPIMASNSMTLPVYAIQPFAVLGAW